LSQRRRALLWWALVAAYLLTIAIAWTRPEFGADYAIRLLARWFPTLEPAKIRLAVVAARKVAHFLGYGVFSVILCNAFLSMAPDRPSRRNVFGRAVLAALGALALAVIDESRQHASPFRTGATADVFLDVLGIATGLALRILTGNGRRET